MKKIEILSTYELLDWSMEGGQAKEAMIALLQSLIQTIQKDQSNYYSFKIKVNGK